MPRHRIIVFVWMLCVATLIVGPSYAQNTKSADKYVKLGVWRLVRSDYDNAIADFNKALASKPNFGLTYFYRGKARQAKGDLDGAIEDYESAFRTDARIVKVAAGVAEVYRTRGMLRLEELNLDQAISDFDKAISFKPDQAENYFNGARHV
jgi:tetratricopeptide (TPR) repeat protein